MRPLLSKQRMTHPDQRRCLIDTIHAMVRQEREGYRYDAYLRKDPSELSQDPFPRSDALSPSQSSKGDDAIRPLNASWREKICQWSYNVVDHFDLPRELVAISLDYFDRFLATQNNRCSGNQALLVSLTTLHIAIKIHSDRRLKISTLASLSRGQFGPEDIEEMEWSIMQSLGWKLHPPTMFTFLSYLLLLLPSDTLPSTRKDLFERSIYIAELSVCDSYFVPIPTYIVSFAALINVMEEMPLHVFPRHSRERFLLVLFRHLGLHYHDSYVIASRRRLLAMFAPTSSEINGVPVSPTGVASADELMEMDMSMEAAGARAYNFEEVDIDNNVHSQLDASASFGALDSDPDAPQSHTATYIRTGVTYSASSSGAQFLVQTSPIAKTSRRRPRSPVLSETN